MTLDEQIDEILHKYWEGIAWDIGPEPRNDDPAKQAITQLIKELVAEAKPIETDDDEYADGWNDAIDQYHTNLLKALEEL